MHSFDFQTYITKFNAFLTIRDLAKNTCDSYNSFLRCYLSWVDTTLGIAPEEVSFEQIRSFILYLKNVKKLSNRSINAYASQIRFLHLYVLKRPWDRYEVPSMRFTTLLPDVLTQQEIRTFIDTMVNLKHKACIALLYSAGLRVSELCHLRYQDVDRKNLRLYIQPSKSRCDRFAILSVNALAILTDYWFAFGKPKGWLFPGMKPDTPIVSFTVSRFLADHVSFLGWEHKVNAHLLRHSFGTHLYEQGTELITIQKLLGHKSINSTTLYIHLATKHSFDVKSPFDTDNTL